MKNTILTAMIFGIIQINARATSPPVAAASASQPT